jgi:KaiC/GvpD/RAD55 family RecA-like ATPase
MEIKANVEDLRKYSLFVATPMYGGMNHGMYMKSCLDLQGLCLQYGIGIKFSFLFNESLITRARNYLVDEFINRSDCTHLLFIDSDITFNPQDVIAMLALDKDVIGGPYPKKSIKWRSAVGALKKNPDIDIGLLDKVVGDFVFNPVQGTSQFNVSEPLSVLEIGTGFMMVKRDVFTKMEEAYPMIRYKPDHVGQANFDGSRYIHAYFDTVIDTKDSIVGGGSDRYLSEDYMFCQMWRKLGGEIWLCPWMRTAHIGTYIFHGDMPAVANFVGEM